MNLEISITKSFDILEESLSLNSLDLDNLLIRNNNNLCGFSTLEKIHQQTYTKKSLIIVPGYSVSNPPRIGDHRYYIEGLKFHPKNNPLGYKQIYLFDLYSRKDGRCNFKQNITQLATELYRIISSSQCGWSFQDGDEIDFIGASMGGLIVRKFIMDYLKGDNLIPLCRNCYLRVRNIALIGVPNFGCSIIDYLQSPIIQPMLRLFFGKNHFAKSEQIKQIAVGRINFYSRCCGKFFKKYSPANAFLDDLNSVMPTPGKIRWITLGGTKSKWFSCFIYSKNEVNDGVVLSSSIPLRGAENIADFHLDFSWNHRDLYKNKDFCNLLYVLLILNLTVEDYLFLQKAIKSNHLLLHHISKKRFSSNICNLTKSNI